MLKSFRQQLRQQAVRDSVQAATKSFMFEGSQGNQDRLYLKADGRFVYQKRGGLDAETHEGLYGYNGVKIELRTAFTFSKSHGPQGGIETISTDRKVYHGTLGGTLQGADPVPEYVRLEDPEVTVLTLAKSTPQLRRVISTPDLLKFGEDMRRRRGERAALQKSSGTASLPDLAQPAKLHAGAQASVGGWLNRLMNQSSNMRSELAHNREVLSNMRGYIQGEYRLAGVPDPAAAPSTVKSSVEYHTHDLPLSLPPI
jgi:hypothetical protein